MAGTTLTIVPPPLRLTYPRRLVSFVGVERSVASTPSSPRRTSNGRQCPNAAKPSRIPPRVRTPLPSRGND